MINLWFKNTNRIYKKNVCLYCVLILTDELVEMSGSVFTGYLFAGLEIAASGQAMARG